MQHWGYKAIAVSVASGQGMAQLAEALDGRISAVAGPSGVGKSSIINALRLRAQHAQHEQQPQREQHAQQAERDQQHGQPDKAQHDVPVSYSNSNSNSDAVASPRAVQSAESANSNLEYSEAGQAPARQQSASSIAPHALDAKASSHDTLIQTADATSSSSQHPSQEDGEQQQHGNGLIIPGQQQHSNKPNAGFDNHASSSRTLQNTEASSSSSLSSTAFGMPSHSSGQHLEEEEEEQVGMRGPSGVAEGVRLQSVGEMSNIGRGMHTTRHVALLEVHCSSSSD